MAGSSYQYDESGQFGYFIITFGLLGLLPWTYFVLSSRKGGAVARIPPPCEGWNAKEPAVKKARKTSALGLRPSHLLLAAGWAALAFVIYRVSQLEAGSATYDPFAILGIRQGLGEKEIKRHYRKLSLKFHPDKLKLAENQTKEEADNHFVELTKAYKALTDETVRRNYELYGYPDGKQDFSMGIALPKWVVEGQNNVYVLGVYAMLFGLLLPYFVGRWWYGSRQYTKDRIHNDSMATFFRELKEDSKFSQIVEILSSAQEFKSLKNSKASSKKDREYDRLEKEVKKELDTIGESLAGKFYKQPACKRAAVFIYAHLCRSEIEDIGLLREKQEVVAHANNLLTGLLNIALAYNWLQAYLLITSLQQHVIQAFHPAFSPVLQLPHITPAIADHLAKKGVKDIPAFVALDEKEKKDSLKDLSDKEYRQTVRVAENWPRLKLISAAFKVVGEKQVTPGSVISLVVKLRLSAPGTGASGSLKANGHQTEATKLDEDPEDDEELEVDDLLGSKPADSEGAVPSGLAHAPRYPGDRKPTWSVFIGDHKGGRMFVQPHKFTDIGYDKTRTIKTTFQAPPQPGLYTLQCYVKSDCYADSEIQAKLKLHIVEPTAVEEEDEEDDISEPEEDSLAGQMAAMRGQPVKKIGAPRRRKDVDDSEEDEDEDDTSGTDEDEEDDSSSDSDSD